MTDLPCNLRQEISAYMGQTEVEFRTDELLLQPILLSPRDQAGICLKSTPFGPSNIALSWTAVPGASLYVLQFGTNPQMQGAGVRQIITASTAIGLTRDTHVRIGETVHWRVFALDLSGGVSPPSETRQFTFNCPDGSDPSTDSELFNLEVELLGQDTIRHCEDTTYYIKLSFTHKDADEREICSFDSTAWEVEFIGAHTGTVTVTPEFGNDLKCTVNSRIDGLVAGNIKLKATLTFTNLITSEEFTKEVTKEIISEPFTYGCGLHCELQCIDNDPLEQTYKIAIDFDAIAGSGLIVNDPRTLDPEHQNYDPCACPVLDVNFGCGFIEKPHCVEGEDPVDRWAVDVEGLAGVGLTVDCNKDPCVCDKLAIDLRDRFGSTYTFDDTNLPGEDTGLTLGAFKQSTYDVTALFSPSVVEVQSGVENSHKVVLELFHINKDEPEHLVFVLGLPYSGVSSNFSFRLDSNYREGGWQYLSKAGLYFTIVAESIGDIVLGGGTLWDGKQYHQVQYNSGSIDTSTKLISHLVSAPTVACDNNRVIYTVYVSESPAVPNPIAPSPTFVKVLEATADYVRNRNIAAHIRDNSGYFNSVYKSSEYDVNLEPMSIISRYNTAYDVRLRDFESPVKTQLVAGTKHNGVSVGGYTLVALTGDTIAHQKYTVPVTITRTLIPLGCNLEAQYLNQEQQDLGEFGFRRIQVNVGQLAGDGLKETDLAPPEESYDPFGCTKLEINKGCGLKFTVEDPEPPGGPRKKLEVDLDQIAGTGLTVVPGAGPEDCPTLAVVPGEFASGCGIDIVDGIISIDYNEVSDSGSYTWEDTSCPATFLFEGCSTGSGLAATQGIAQAQGLVYYATPLEGCPYFFTKVNIPYNCTLEIDSGNLGLDLGIFGKGLKVTEGVDECPSIELCVPDGTMPIPANEVTGDDLTNISLGTKALLYGVVEFADAVDPEDCGLIFTKTFLPVDCHFTTDNDQLTLNLASLAGSGLSVTNETCPKLQVDSFVSTAGCGINIAGTEISIDFSAIATSEEYTWSDVTCSATLATGCSTGTGLSSTAGVFQLPGPVLYDTTPGPCPKLHSRANLPFNCSLEIDNGNLGLNYGIFGKGLRVNSDDCPEVELCVPDGTSPILTEDLVGTDLTSGDAQGLLYGEVYYEADVVEPLTCGRLVTKTLLPVDCHFNFGTELQLDVASLAGPGLSVTDDPCPKLQATPEDILCDVPTVTPNPATDFVLGLRVVEGVCQVVKFAITECP